jgi:acetyltransferase-like isoleucine patch superfamily enzyme
MNKDKVLKDKSSYDLYQKILELHEDLDTAFINSFQRSLPINEEIIDRWNRAHKLGFGKDSSIYDSSFVFGDVKVGSNCWIGPYSIIDGSGGLEIGNYCTISAGVHIYSHDNIQQTLSSGKQPIERKKVRIGNNVYIGPNSIITKGVKIGNYCVIGAFSLINKDIPDHSIVFGQPGIIKGSIQIINGEINFIYNKDK